MKVLHLVDYFTQPTQTFIKRYVQKTMQFAEVAVASFEFYQLPSDIEEHVKLYKINNPQFSRKNLSGAKRYLFEKITGKEFWYSQFNEILKEFKPDIIHCHFGTMGILMMEFSSKYPVKIPYATTIYAYDITSLPAANEKYRKNLQKLWLKGTGFFAEGPSLAEKFVAAGCPPEKCIINPLLIPIAEYPLKTHYRTINDPIKFLFIGRFVEKKGFHIFLEAIGKLCGKINEFTIDIIGAGPMDEQYRQLVGEYNLEPFIKWHGMVNHDNIIPMLKDYDFLVHPSLKAKDNDSEGGSATIIIEAEAVGLPIITTDHDDIPFVMGYADFLAKENDPDSLIEVLERMVNCDTMQDYAKQGIKKVYELHDLNMNTSYEANLKLLADKN
ncbi:MAG: glycosyltransferase [Bacteroidota bacterium]|nr:glycosyltransferase [Bacteroidota bacterium]